jgi:hypothetical protein
MNKLKGKVITVLHEVLIGLLPKPCQNGAKWWLITRQKKTAKSGK